MSQTHACGWTYEASDKYCRGCGERIMKISREFNELKAEMKAVQQFAAQKGHPAMAAVAMMLFNVLAWASGESQVRPLELLKEMEKISDKFPGFGFQPPGGGPPGP